MLDPQDQNHDGDTDEHRVGSANLATALYLAAAGIPIFPAVAYQQDHSSGWQKKPLVREWQNAATTDPEQIKGWFQRSPHAIPGIELGRARLVVIDADRHGGPDGVSALEALVAQHGALPTCPQTHTAGNGMHFFFKQLVGQAIGNRRGSLPAGIDVRGEGGWIVAPGATRADGAQWRSLQGKPDLGEAYRSGTIPSLPEWMVAEIRAPRDRSQGRGARPVLGRYSQTSTSREAAFATAALEGCIDELKRLHRGSRNNTLNAAAYRMGRMSARGWIDRAHVADGLWKACELNGLLRDDGPDAVQQTLASGFKAGESDPHPDLHEGPSTGASRAERINEMEKASLLPITLDDLLGLNIKPREFIVELLICERGLVMVYAWRGVGKTWFALGLGHAIAAGGTYLKWTAKKARRVLHVCGEMPAVDLQGRFKAVVAATDHRPPDPGYLRIISADLHELGVPDLSTPEGQAAMDAVLGDAEVIIFDNVSTLFRTGQENESESWAPVQGWLLKLRREGRAVVIIHHSNKARTQRGTSKREDVLDIVLNLREPSDYEPSEGARFEVHFEKARGLTGTEAVSPFEARLEMRDGVAVWTLRDIEDARLAEILDLKAEGLSVRSIAKELGMSKSAVQRALDKDKKGKP